MPALPRKSSAREHVECRCVSNGCARYPNGFNSVDPRTAKKHGAQDDEMKAAVERARAQALSENDEVICQQLAAMTMADRISTFESGRLWGDEVKNKVHRSRTERRRSEGLDMELNGLQKIEEEFTEFSHFASQQVQLALLPLTPLDSCPYDPLYAKAKHLRHRVQIHRTRLHEVKTSKDEIEERVLCLIQQLDGAKAAWVAAFKKLACTTQGEASHIEDTEHTDTEVFDTSMHFEPILENINETIQLTIFMVAAMQVILRTARRGCSWIFDMVRQIIFVTLLHTHSSRLSASDEKLISDLPRDLDTAMRSLRLEKKRTYYAVCPAKNCHRNYKATYKPGDSIPYYPTYCEEPTSANGGTCRTRLTRPRTYNPNQQHPTTIQVPIKTFVGFCMKDYIAGLLSSSENEHKMDTMRERQRSDGVMSDIVDGEYLKSFKGVDGELFCGEGRYAFSLCVDFFNPDRAIAGKKPRSVGVISLAPLSLPAGDRYKPENLFVYGIVPGPKEPPLTSLNHYLEGLIDDLLAFWEGIFFSSTSKYPGGRLIRCALIVVACDLPAARKVAGMSAPSHQFFCSVCKCTLANHGYSNLDYHSWERRTDAEIRATSQEFKNAPNTDTQKTVFANSGVRWSQLSRLPYFNMAECIAVDAMHNLFLGLVKEHMRILGISLPISPTEPGPIVMTIPIPDPTPNSMSKSALKSYCSLREYLQGPLSNTLESNPGEVRKRVKEAQLKAMDYMGRALGCDTEPTPDKVTRKEYWIDKIVAWRSRQVESKPEAPVLRAGYVLTSDEREAIWSDIRGVTRPSWLTSIPANIGEPSAGKLKADQYRVLAQVYLPTSLIRLWSEASPDDTRAEQRERILDVTMSLVSALSIATSRKTSVNHADQYFAQMHKYLRGIKELFPHYNFVPNQHMALHLGEFIKRFGPVHGWWTFPFERLIGMLQRISTNGKIGGELEQTIALSYTRSASLRSLFAKTCCPQSVRDTEDIFNKFVNTRSENDLVNDMMSLFQADGYSTSISADANLLEQEDEACWNNRTAITVPATLHESLRLLLGFIPHKVQMKKNLTMNGISFSVSSKHPGNSSVMIRDAGRSTGTPARIDYILQYIADGSMQTVFGVSRYLPWMGGPDPFTKYQLVRARLWQREVDLVTFIEPSKIGSHFAYSDLRFENKNAMLVISLERVLHFADITSPLY